MAMNFDELKDRIDFFDKTFEKMSKSVADFIKSLQGGDSSKFAAYIEQLDEIQKKALVQSKQSQKIKEDIQDQENLLKKLNKELKKGLATQQDINDAKDDLKKLNDDLNKQLDDIRKSENEMKKLNEAVKGVVDTTDALAGKMKLVSYHNTSLYKIIKTFTDGENIADKFGLALDTVIGRVRDLIEPTNLLANGIDNMVKSTISMVMSLNDSLKSFESQTGIVDVYNSMVWDAYKTNQEFSVSLQDISDSTQGLIKDMISFNLMSMQNRKRMVELVSLYSKFGATTYELAEALGEITDTFGLASEGASQLLQELRGLQNSIGGTFREMLDDWEDSASRLARHGLNQMKTSFKQLSVISKSLKLDFDQLFEVVDQFDTFESATEAVGRFNAIAGGPYLNAISMMRQTEDERAKSIIQGIKASKINYNLLNAQEKQALAASIGIKDMAVAQRMFTGSLDDYYRLRNLTNESEKEAEAKAKNLASIQDKLNTIFEMFAVIVEPILDVVSWLLSAFIKMFAFFKDNWIPILITVIGLMVAYRLALTNSIVVAATFAIVSKKMSNAVSIAGAGFKKFFSFFKTGAQSAAAAASGIAATGSAAAAATGPGIGLIAVLKALGEAAIPIAKGILIIGAAIAAVIVIFKSIDSVVGLISSVFKSTGKIIEGFGDLIGDTLSGIGGGIKDFLTDSPLEELGQFVEILSASRSGIADDLSKISSSLSAMTETFNSVDQDNIQKFTEFLENLSDFSELEKLSEVLSNIAEQVEKLNSTSVISITRNVSDLFEAAGKISTSNTTEIKNIATEIIRISEETDEAKLVASKELLKSSSSSESNQASSSGQVTNIIQLNGRELSRWFSSEINKMGFSIGK